MNTSQYWFSAAAGADLGEEIATSLKFDASGYLTRAQSSSGDGLISTDRTFTFSTWFKIGKIDTSGVSEANLFGIHHSGSNENWLLSLSSETFADRHNTGSTTPYRSYDSSAKFRDPSAWYHLFLTCDNNVLSLRVNNVLLNQTNTQASGMDRDFWIGSEANGGSPMTGYLADTYFIQGTVMNAVNDGFIRLNSAGVYVPDTPTISSYGTNGWHLTYDNTQTNGIGHDSSGNGNHFTATNFNTTALKIYDSLADSSSSGTYGNNPTNNDVHNIFDGDNSQFYYSDGPSTLDLGDLGADLGTGVSTIVVRTYPRLGTNTITVNSTTGTASGNSNQDTTINHDGSAITTFTVSGTDSAYFGVASVTVDGTMLVNTTENDIAQSDTPTTTSPAVTLNGNDMNTTAVIDGGSTSFSSSSTWHKSRATQPYPSTGTWYYEYHAEGASGWIGAVQGNKPLNNDSLGSSSQTGYWVYINDGTRNFNGSYSSGGTGMSAGDIIGVTYNASTDTMKWYRNNILQLTATSVTPDTQSNLLFPLISVYGQDDNRVNYGQYTFAYTPPDSAKGCHEFLAETEPTIKDGKDHFGVLTYTGAGSSANITGLDFQPDLVWIKNRDVNDFHTLYDSVRGVGKRLVPNDTDAEFDQSNSLNGFISGGFSVGGHNSVAGSGEDYVAWCWKAGTSYTPTVTGFTSPSASINTTAGFGIYKFTGNNTASSFTHGLNERPQLVIAKTLGTNDWAVFGPTSTSTALAATATFHRFNLNDYVTKTGNVLTAVSDTTLSFGSFSETAGSNDYIYYCWHSVEGYSKVGSYYGTGNNTGKFTYCGFKPAWVMIKCINQNGDWNIYDSTRNTHNPNQEVLKGNRTNTEQVYSGEDIDFLANGFRCRGLNANINETYHYMYLAFAEHPYGGENVPRATAR